MAEVLENHKKFKNEMQQKLIAQQNKFDTLNRTTNSLKTQVKTQEREAANLKSKIATQERAQRNTVDALRNQLEEKERAQKDTVDALRTELHKQNERRISKADMRLWKAAKNNDLAGVEENLDDGAVNTKEDPEKGSGWNAAAFAAKHGNLKMLKA